MTNIGHRPGTAIVDPNQKSDYVRQLEAAAAAIGSAGVQYVKFQKGWWLLGREGLQFPNNEFYFMPNLQNVVYGWQCWRNSQCIEDRWYSAGERIPEKTSLPDHGPYSKQNDGWQKSVKLELLILPDPSAPVQEAIFGMFISSSTGGLNAVSKLLRDYSTGLKTGHAESEQIIVRATTDTYVHKQYGPTPYPVFDVTQWMDELSAIALMEGYGVSLPPTMRAAINHQPTPAPQVQRQPYAPPAAPAPAYAPPAPTAQVYAAPAPQPPRQFGGAPAPVAAPAPVYAAPQPQAAPPSWEGPSTIPPQQPAPVAAPQVQAPQPARQFGGAQPAPAVAQPMAPPVRRFVAAGAPPVQAPPPVQSVPAGPAPTAVVDYGQQAPAAPAPAPVAAPAPAPVPAAPPPVQAAPAPAQAAPAGAPPVARRGHPRRPPAAAPAGTAPDAPAVAGAAVDAALGDGSV